MPVRNVIASFLQCNELVDVSVVDMPPVMDRAPDEAIA
jgi:hypothetical protein